jgi:hypothetical protein
MLTGGRYEIVFKYLDLNNSQHMYWTIKVVKLNSQKLTVKLCCFSKNGKNKLALHCFQRQKGPLQS